MSIYGTLIQETNLKSNLDKDYQSKGKKKLSEFKKVKIDQNFINQYKPTDKFLRYIDPKDYGFGWIDSENKLVGVAVVDNSKKDEYVWITAIEVSKIYRGYGLGNQLLDFAVKELHGNALSVAVDNEVAKRMYEKYGFKVSKESLEDVKAGRKSVYFMYL